MSEARSNGFLVGAYHFGEPGQGVVQADSFLNTVNPGPDTLLALDFERGSAGLMGIQDAVDFVTHIHQQLNRWPVIYGGADLKQQLARGANETLSHCPLWQFSDDNYNRPASPVPGVSPPDRDRFAGSAEDLAAQWPF